MLSYICPYLLVNQWFSQLKTTNKEVNKEVMHQCVRVKDVSGSIWSLVDDVRGPAPMVPGVERSFK